MAAVICEPIEYYQFEKLTAVKAKTVLRILAFPIIATLAMVCCLLAVKTRMDTIGLLELAILLCAGGLVYLAVLLAGRFVGRDYDVIELFKELRKSF